VVGEIVDDHHAKAGAGEPRQIPGLARRRVHHDHRHLPRATVRERAGEIARGLDRQDLEVRRLEPLARARLTREDEQALHSQLSQLPREGQTAPGVAQPDVGPRVGTEDDTRRGRHRR
jgi:hypothetical protein